MCVLYQFSANGRGNDELDYLVVPNIMDKESVQEVYLGYLGYLGPLVSQL